MMLSATDQQLVADHEALWSVVNGFFGKFTALDWSSAHGNQWTFGEVPYHLMYFNRLLGDAINAGRSMPQDQLKMVATMQQLNVWNDSHFAQRPPGYTGMKAFEEMQETQAVLRDIIQSADFDSPAWLPLLQVRGWRTVRFVVEYSYFHTWYHLAEAYLRFYSDHHLPELTTAQHTRALDFYMDVITA
ncbi:MAG TPA: DinB family protein, partial [Phototrophicaceae bacterium]|nr:DinB family protein [Phototrophicaceae bacterium]